MIEEITLAGPLYPNQPLVEVTTEVRFNGELAIEALRPNFQNHVRKHYPNLMVPGAQQGIAPSLQPIRFESDDKLSGIQLAINSFSYYTRQYPGHEIFIKNLNQLVEDFLSMIGSIQVNRIGWRYINAIPFTRENGLLPLNRYFCVNNYFGNMLDESFSDVNFSALKPLDGKQLNIKIETASTKIEPYSESILLDIDVFDLFEPPVNTKQFSLIEGIKSVHDTAYGVFESMISKTYREYLRGSNDE